MKYCKIKGSNNIYLIEKEMKDYYTLSFNNKKIKIKKENVEKILENYSIPEKKTTVHVKNTSCNIPNEIMLRHEFKEDAISMLDKYLDEAYIAKLGRVKIIHGRHGGILRKAVHEYLKNHPYVKEYHIGDSYEGGIGVTIAILGTREK